MREMKDSGVEWIGEIPAKWKCMRLKFAFGSSNVGESIDKDLYSEAVEGYIFYTAGANPVKTSYLNFPGWKYTTKNDILLARNGTPYVYLPEIGSVYSDHIIRIDIKDGYDKRFLRYCLQRSIESVIVDTVSIATWSISLWKEQVLPLPSYEEQTKIADYLDSKCSKIDAIIGCQEEIIEKLKEYKLSLIRETVIGGLNPGVEKKDSGYDFIGNIPSHWNICRLRNIGTSQNGISKGGGFFGHGYPFVTYGDVYRNYSLPNKVSGLIESTDKERELYSVEKGDIFFTRTSETIEEVGFSCVCEETIPDACFAGFLIRVRPDNDRLYTGYAKYYFRSNHQRYYLVKEMNLVTRASLGQNLLKSMPVLVPPKKEQEEIALYLDRKTREIDQDIKKRQAMIDKFYSYKKSLIYEVVTGKKEV